MGQCALIFSSNGFEFYRDGDTLYGELVEKYMDTSFVQEMKEALEKERDNLRKDLDSISTPDDGEHVPGDRAPKQPDYGDDNFDENTNSPAEVAQFAENVDATGILEKRLNEVEAALARIAGDTFGKNDAGEEIAEDRLRANPAATE